MGKRFAALVTVVVLDAGVDEGVLSQMALVGEKFTTFLTFVILDPRVEK